MRLYFWYVRSGVRVRWICVCLCLCACVCAKPFVCFFPLFYFSAEHFSCESKGGASFFSRKRRSPFDTLPPPNRKSFFSFFFVGFFPTWTLFTCIDRYTHVCATVFQYEKKRAWRLLVVVVVSFFFSLLLFASRKYDYVCGLKID